MKTKTREMREVIELETVNDSCFDCVWLRIRQYETAHLSYWMHSFFFKKERQTRKKTKASFVKIKELVQNNQ